MWKSGNQERKTDLGTEGTEAEEDTEDGGRTSRAGL